jgi:hypothetical protein
MVRIRRIGIIQTATVAAALYATFILVVFAVVGLVVLFAGAAPSNFNGLPDSFGGLRGVGAVIIAGLFAAILYAIVGWIATAVACALYNLVARWTGGVELYLEQRVPPPAPHWTYQPPTPPAG